MIGREIVAIDRANGIAVTDADELCRITNLFDVDGDETDQIDDAVTAVARLDDDHWFSIDLREFERLRLN